MILLPPKTTMKNWSILQRMFYQFVKLVLPRFMRIFFRFEENNNEFANIFPEATPVIFCSNHRSHLDALIFASALVYPYGERTMCGFMGSGKAMQSNMFFGLVKYLGAFPVYPENPEPALEYAYKLLKENIAVFLAPQGKRIPSNPIDDYHNLIKEGKSGIGRLVLRFNGKIPVVPMYIHGSREALGLGKIIPKYNSMISISFCKPLFFTQYSRKEGWDNLTPEFYTTARKIVDRIMESIKDQMMIQEHNYFELLERTFKIQIKNAQVYYRVKSKINKFLFKLLEYDKVELKKFVCQLNRRSND
jgi:1-acyl-sn-glycerol-3-phosphate acyltransferase